MHELISIHINSHQALVPRGISVAAALAYAGLAASRISLTGEPRAAMCGMGVCHECRVTIDQQMHQLACQTLCLPGMRISTLATAATSAATAPA